MIKKTIKLLLVFITRLRNKIGCCSTYVIVTEEINISCWLAMNIFISTILFLYTMITSSISFPKS